MPDRIGAELEVLDERFRSCGGDAWTQRLFTGCRWAEGPAYFPAGPYLGFSGTPHHRVLRFDQLPGKATEFRAPAGAANGHTSDWQWRLISCEHGTRQVTRTEHDGSVTVLASRYDGKRRNSPNDVVERSGGSVWFTDPSYGIDSDYEGHKAPSETGACHIYRIAPEAGEARIAAAGFLRPNGLAFSAGERQLYIADTRTKHIRLFDVAGGGALSAGEVFATRDAGSFDGIRLDDTGRIWAAAHDGVHCFDPDGTLLGKLHLPEAASNLTFGGAKRNDLFITATSSVYSLRLNTTGARYPASSPPTS